jgi:two-component system, NtrC family, response regulator AtoC
MLNHSANKPRILIVDDDDAMRSLLEAVLKEDGVVFLASNRKQALEILSNQKIDIVLLDIKLGTDNGIEVLKVIKPKYEHLEIIMITVVKDLRTAIEAMKHGAYDYINKDFHYDELKILIRKACRKLSLDHEVKLLRREIKELTEIDFIIGQSPKIKEIDELIKRVAAMPSSILIQGESGTGKEMVARRMHQLGNKDKPHQPFVAVNLASIPSELIESTLFGHEKGSFTGAHKTHKGKFELAHGGTLFLDEIGELKPELQAKLLRALQEREIERVGGESSIQVNVRIVAASNKDLKKCVELGTFREDLYYRLNVIPICLPPLRERLEDLPDFINLFLTKFSKKLNKTVSSADDQVIECFNSYTWPGNIRELENIMERMIALSDKSTLTIDDVPLEQRFFDKKITDQEVIEYDDLLKEATSAFEKRFILSALNRKNWNQIKAAEELGIHRKTLEYKIKRLNLQKLIEDKKRLHKIQVNNAPS